MIKKTSFSYGQDHQEKMLEYFHESKEESENNHNYLRVKLALSLVDSYVKSVYEYKNKAEIIIADIGCSVGLMAINFAKNGYRSIGYDFDPSAIQIAKKLAIEEGVEVDFFKQDASSQEFNSPIDIALCFDMFEHLHDDEIGVLLYNLKKRLTNKGCVVFHTLPMQYDYIFWSDKAGKLIFPRILSIFKNGPVDSFEKKVKIYALLKDAFLLNKQGITHKESIKKSGHPNPLTRKRLIDIVDRSGFEFVRLETGFLGDSQYDQKDKAYFKKHEICHRSLYGIIKPCE